MGALLKLIAIAGPAYFVLLALARLLLRRRRGFSIPRWVHAIAAISTIVGVWLAWESQEVGGTELWRDVAVVLVLPALTYLGYGFYGALFVPKDDDPSGSVPPAA